MSLREENEIRRLNRLLAETEAEAIIARGDANTAAIERDVARAELDRVVGDLCAECQLRVTDADR